MGGLRLTKIKRLFVVDAMAMAFRNYHAFSARPLATSKGVPTSAVYGSAMFLIRLLEHERPDYFAIALDSREPTFRHLLFPAYKANRKAMPEDMVQQLPYLTRLYHALGIKVLCEGGLEADDLIGSMVHQLAADDLHCYIVSGDKDFLQLINPRVSLYSPKKGNEVQLINEPGVLERFGCRPEQVIDVLALMGDSSDNVPGVYGIGDKGAALLVQKYGSLDGIYSHLDEIANKRQREGLQTHKDAAYLSRHLVTIKVDGSLGFTLDDLASVPEQHLARRDLLELCEELEFGPLAAKVSRHISEAARATTRTSEVAAQSIRGDEDYHLITDAAAFDKMMTEVGHATELTVDTETTGLDLQADVPVGISLAVRPGHGFYVPLTAAVWGGALEGIKSSIGALLANENQVKVGHNLKFDLHMLANINIAVKGPLRDTMIASWLVDAGARIHGLDACCLKYLNYVKIPTTDLIGKDASVNMRDVPLDKLTRYAVEDADLTLQLYQKLRELIKENDLEYVFENVEMPLVQVLTDMERAGVFVDSDALVEISEHLDARSKELTEQIQGLAGEVFNLNSTKQLQVILFEKLKVQDLVGKGKRLKKTKSGYSTDVSVLEMLSEHPICSALLEYRQVTKIKGTYVDALPQLIHPRTGRLHTTFQQTGTATGRLSSMDPNLQNIPVRSELGREVRKAFRAHAADWVILSADYSQVELRVLAHLANEAGLKQAFAEGQDIHTATAARIFGVPPETVTPEQRSQAKAINFGIIYGMGPQRLARDTGVSQNEAKEFIQRYFATYPGIRTYIDDSIQFARQNLYTRTITGRRRPLAEINSSDRMTFAAAQNIAVNSPVQGSAADLIKLAMIRIQKQLDESSLGAKMLLQVHDELVFECPRSEVAATAELVKREMEAALMLDVPLKVDVGSGSNWLEAH